MITRWLAAVYLLPRPSACCCVIEFGRPEGWMGWWWVVGGIKPQNEGQREWVRGSGGCVFLLLWAGMVVKSWTKWDWKHDSLISLPALTILSYYLLCRAPKVVDPLFSLHDDIHTRRIRYNSGFSISQNTKQLSNTHSHLSEHCWKSFFFKCECANSPLALEKETLSHSQCVFTG